MEVPTMYYAHESNPTNIGKSKRKNPGLRPWPQTKKCPWWNALQEGHLSPSKDLSPASASFPCCFRSAARLFMEVSVSGWFVPRCASRPARARRCRASAWCLGMMASVVWGPGLDPPVSTMWPCGKGRKMNNGLVFGLMKKMLSTIVPCKCTHKSKFEE